MWLIYALLLFSEVSGGTTSHNAPKCQLEFSSVHGTTTKTKWISFDNQIVISVPPCLNLNNELITRTCSNGSWHPDTAPVCRKLLDKNFSNLKNFWSSLNLQAIKSVDSGTKLILSFEEERKELSLLVYSPEGILKDDDDFMIYCFTNSAKTDLKRTSKLSKVFENDENFPNSLLVFRVQIQKFMGEYWCEAITKTLSLLSSDKVIAYKRKKGNEYALRVVIGNICKICSCSGDNLFRCLVDDKLEEIFHGFSPEIRIMEVFSFDTYKDVMDLLVHVSTGKQYSVETEFLLLTTKLEKLKVIKVIYFRSSEFCLLDRTVVNGTQLTWPLTKVSTAAAPREFCFMKTGTPVIRRCQGDFLYGAVWANVIGQCIEDSSVSDTTIKLREMTTTNLSLDRVWSVIKAVNLTVLDIYYLTTILGRIGGNDSSYAFDFVNKLMTTDQQILEKSQLLLNLTDSTLEATDDVLSNLILTPDLVYLKQRKKLIVHVANPFETNVSGLLIYGDKKSVSVLNFNRSDDFDTIDTQNLLLAVSVPETILDQILNETDNNASEVFIITTVFYNDRLFVDEGYHSGSFVVSVSIPGYGSYLQTSIPIIFESKNSSKKCGFWDNGKKTNWRRGQWSLLGSNYVKEVRTDLHKCSFVHLTHFALLLMSDRKNLAENEEEVPIFDSESDDSLEIITIVGCSLSVVGILGIFLTALFFKKWRDKIGTKILINLSVAILLEIICIHLSSIKTLKASENLCKIIGMVLHFFVLSKFSWMLIYAFLQYYRFVKVLGTIPKNIILKSVIAGWGAPLSIVFLVGLLSTESYVSESYQLCYPRGLLLYLTVLLPVCLIVLANLTVFCLIMYNVTYKMNSTNKKLFRLRLYLALLLFSVLGLPWFFGIIAELMYFSLLKIVLFHLFCITATLQGFILFLFYVVLNKETREYWSRYFRTKIC